MNRHTQQPMLRRRGAGARQRQGFTLIELLIVVVVLSLLASIALTRLHKAVVKARIAAVISEGKALHAAFNTFYVDYNQYPNATSSPSFQLDTFDPLRSRGYYAGAVTDLLQGSAADAYDSPDDEGPNQEFWLQLTVEADPSVQIVVASSDNAPLAGGRWLEGVFMFKDGELRSSFQNY